MAEAGAGVSAHQRNAGTIEAARQMRDAEQNRRREESVNRLVRDSWYFGPPPGIGQPSAPLMDFQEEEPPPSYHQVIVETQRS